jgi:hypothetical protein
MKTDKTYSESDKICTQFILLQISQRDGNTFESSRQQKGRESEKGRKRGLSKKKTKN